MQNISINFQVPQGWHELGDKQLRYVYQLLASDFSADEIKTLCLLQWSDTKVIGKQPSGAYLLRKGKTLFEATPLTIAELLPALDWLASLPNVPVRMSKINRRTALTADFSEVPFETFIICDNLYQGYLATQDDDMLDQLGATLYGLSTKSLGFAKNDISFKPYERISIYYWFASLKEWLGKKYSDFFQPMEAATGGNLLRAPSMNVEDAMNAQIRALTKGDITKEAEVLALDTHRALTELNAQAREYKELNAKTDSK